MFCYKCGVQAPEDSGFCHKCGTKLITEDNRQVQFRDDDKLMAVLSYLGFLWLVPLCTGAYKNSEFVNFHFNQGTIILIIAIGWGIISSIIRGIFIAIFFWFPVVSGLVHAAITIVSLGIVALMIWGIVGAVKDRMDPMPIIGDIKLFK